ncbi:MAG: protoporphyrinogen/coproporphyrinogen oxidase [Thermoguttaceae bacterium]
MPQFAILGSGMAGCGAAYRLGTEGFPAVMYDQRSYYGGHTASHRFAEGFTLDEGPHISFTENERVKSLLAESVGGEYFQHEALVNNYWQGYWIRHPAQCNLYGLPEDLVTKIIVDFVAARQKDYGPIANYEQWLRASFGDTFAETFPLQYTKKYHTTTADNLSIDWIGPRLYAAHLEEVLRGALSPNAPNVHYITGFRYPKRGGFVSYLKSFVAGSDLKLAHRLVRLDPLKKRLHFANGAVESYEQVISSIPLPEVVPMIDGVPADVLDASRRLACSEAVIVSVGVNRPDPIDSHWTYFYDEDVCFTRLSTPHLQSRNNVPEGSACLMAECYFSAKYRPLDCRPEECIEPVIADLRRCGVIRQEDRVIFTNALHLEYANIIFDLERSKAVQTVHAFLDDLGVNYCGRYGHWAYIWTDQAFLSGEKAAERGMKRVSTACTSIGDL